MLTFNFFYYREPKQETTDDSYEMFLQLAYTKQRDTEVQLPQDEVKTNSH